MAPPTNAGYTLVDYRLPKKKAQELLDRVRVSSDFHTGQIMIFDMSVQDMSSSYFFTPTQNCYHKLREKEEWTPTETLDIIKNHVPMGSLMMRLGTAIRTSSSLLMHLDLSQYATLEGLSAEETMSRILFENHGFLTYRAKDGSLVKHTAEENPWTLLPEVTTSKPNLLDQAQMSHTPNTVLARAPPTILLKEVRRVAACLGEIKSFKLSELTNPMAPSEQIVEVCYVHKESMLIAEGFQLGSVYLEVATSNHKDRDALLQFDPGVADEDRLLAACLSAGTKYGSLEELHKIREEEEALQKYSEPVDVSSRVNNAEVPEDDDEPGITLSRKG
mmetsp:Transcript_127091/g.219917  ORF Transcript_127091/g.219917 Transcript_127091/m.219917 type:complete len:332 (+) Transcript_127091:1588-2583(+)